jgi:CheY-like chemotaxis protein
MWHHLCQALDFVRAVLSRLMSPRRYRPGNSFEEPEAGPAEPRVRGILVVDDEPAIRTLLQAALPRYGFQVFVAASGPEALAVYREHRAEIAAVLLDVLMPGADGPQTLRTLRAIDPHVRCCFMSGNLGDYTEEELLHLGAAQVFPKPFRLLDVVQTLKQSVATRH